jgi:lysophospholipase L1-like esterase
VHRTGTALAIALALLGLASPVSAQDVAADLPAGVCLARDPADETFFDEAEVHRLTERLRRLGPPCAGPLLGLAERQPSAPVSRLVAETVIEWGDADLLPRLYRTFGWSMLQPIQRKEDLAFEMATAIATLSGEGADLLAPAREGGCCADWPRLALERYEQEWGGALADGEQQAPDREDVLVAARGPFLDCLARPDEAPAAPYDPLGLMADDPVARLGLGTRCASAAVLEAWRSTGTEPWSDLIDSLEGMYAQSHLHPIARELELAWGQGRGVAAEAEVPVIPVPESRDGASPWWALLLLVVPIALVPIARSGDRGRRLVFRVLAVAAGFAMLGALELLLRVVDAPPGDAFRPPESIARPTQLQGEGAANVQDQRGRVFAVPRPGGVARIAVIGASSVAGPLLTSPQTIPARLEQRLAPAVPCAEVINLGHHGLASPGLRTIAVEAVQELEADLVVLYAGHNEVGDMRERDRYARVNPHLYRSQAALVRTRLYGLLSLAVGPRAPSAGAPSSDAAPSPSGRADSTWVDRLDLRFERAVELRFERELVDLVRAVRRADRPLVFALPSFNHHGLQLSWWEPPKEEIGPPTIEGMMWLLRDGHAEGASEMARGMVELDPGHPTPRFVLALAREAAGDLQGAEDAVWAAARRNHAGSTITPGLAGIIDRVAARYAVPLADADDALHRAAGRHLPGNDLFFDFVHLNPAGAQVVADELATTIDEAGLVEGLAALCR